MAENKYGKYLVKKPAREVMVPGISKVKGREYPTMTYMSNDLVPGCNVYIELGWIWDIPDPNPHIPEHYHNYNEIVLHIGSDPNNPEDKGVKHGPLTWKRVDRPHIQMSIMLGAGTLAESAPGGYSGK